MVLFNCDPGLPPLLVQNLNVTKHFVTYKGYKYFELNNHLGNVLTTVSDRRIGVSLSSSPLLIDHYTAVIMSSSDYYAFGSPMAGRSYSSGSYRYGFNGQELDKELDGTYTAANWEYDARLGRRWNLDPKPNASMSGFVTFSNNPIWFYDMPGDTPSVATRIWGAAKLIGGVLESSAGAAVGVGTSWTGVGAVAGGIVFVHGADVASTGLRQLWSGEEEQSLTHQGISNSLQVAGVSKSTAEYTAANADMAISLAGGGVSALSTKSQTVLTTVRSGNTASTMTRIATQQLGKPASSVVLSENMIAAGAVRPAETAAHHIVAGGHPNHFAVLARQILQKAKVDINSASNGVYLPKNLATAKAPAATHSTVHTNVYFENVYKRLNSVPLNKVAKELEKIAAELQKGTFKIK